MRVEGSVVLLPLAETLGRCTCADRGLSLKSVCDRAADREADAATGIGVVALRLALDVRLRLLSPVDCASNCVA